jgi:prenyl protein peptidase
MVNIVFSEAPLSTNQAHFYAFLFSFLYVGSVYVSKNARLTFNTQTGHSEGQGRNRDDPEVIKIRLVSVTVATAISCGLMYAIIQHAAPSATSQEVIQATLIHLGLVIPGDNVLVVLRPYLVTPSLFIGPLYVLYLFRALPFQPRNSIVSTLCSWLGARNLIVAPFTEELTFRSCVIAVYHLSGTSRLKLIFLTPLMFGLAHIHHAWEVYNRFGRNKASLQMALTSSSFQFAYTTLFGFLCSFLFLRTGSILVPFSAHMFCNSMGFPDIKFHLRCFPKRRKAILLAYLAGIAAFCYTLVPWTSTPDSLYWGNVAY